MNKGQAWGGTAHPARQRKNCNDQVGTCVAEPSDAQPDRGAAQMQPLWLQKHMRCSAGR